MDKRLKHLNALRSFESAARHQSYSKAAQELFVSQAAVSQQMRLLEESLALKLFVRTGRKMRLTDSGEKLYQATSQAFTTLIQGLNSIQCEGLSGNLTITSTQSFSSLWLMPRIYKFSILYPEINVKIVGSNHIENLQQGHIDLAIRFSEGEKINTPQNMECVDFGFDSVYPVCSPKVAEQMSLKEPEDLLKCWLVNMATKGNITWKNWFEAAEVNNFEQHKMWSEVSSSDLALSAVLAGHGVALVSKALFSQYLDVGQLVVPFDIKHPVFFKRYFVYDPNSAKKSRIAIFMKWMREEMQNYEKSDV